MAPRYLAALLFVVYPPFVSPAHAEHDSGKWDCNGGNMLEIGYCAAERLKHADTKLNRVYQAQQRRLRTEESKTRLREAQRAWVSFRDKDCLYQAGLPSGSGWALDDLSCRQVRTEQRIRELEEYLNCTQNGCPE